MSRRHRSGGLAACVALLAGCSAIEINVDVYKGPLANDEAIQLRQYASLAMAAKPVISLLRNDLNGVPRMGYAHDEQSDRRLYRFDDRYGANSAAAQYLNGVLSYYDDSDPPEIAALRLAPERLRRALNVIDAKDDRKGRAIGDELSKANLSEQQLALACAWRYLLRDNDDRRMQPCSERIKKVTGDIPNDRNRHEVWQKVCEKVQDPTMACAADKRANSVYEFMTDPARVGAHAAFLFGWEHPSFVAHSAAVGRAFLDARSQMKVLMDAAIRALDSEGVAAANGARPGLTAEVSKSAREVLVKTVQHRLLTCVAKSVQPMESESEQRASPLAQLKDNNVTHWIWNEPARDLAEALRLLDHHARHLTPSALSDVSCNDERHRPLSAREFGIAAGPENVGDVKDLVKALGGVHRGLLVTAGHAWGSGRPKDGLETLYIRFSEALTRHADNPLHTEVQDAAAALTDALIPFAERLLFVVNNSSLFGADGGDPALRAVLQTLANTIVLQANDLRRRRVHSQRQREGFASELAAAQSAHSPTRASIVRDLAQRVADEVSSRDGAVQARMRQLDRAKTSEQEARTGVQAARERLEAAQAQLRDHKALLAAHVWIRGAALPELLVAVKGCESAAARGKLGSELEKGAHEWMDAVGRAAKDGIAPTVARTQVVDALDRVAKGEGSADYKAVVALVREYLNRQEVWSAESTPRSAADHLEHAKAQVQKAFMALPEVSDKVSQVSSACDVLLQAEVRQQRIERDRTVAERALVTEKERLQMAESARDLAGQAFRLVAEAPLEAGSNRPDDVQARVLAELRTLESNADDQKQKSIELAQKIVLEASLPSDFPFSEGHYAKPDGSDAGRRPPRTRTQVIDDLISVLRHRHVRALQSDPKSAEQIQQAIAAAVEHRNSQIFLRPASDYLRSIYAATSLQESADDPNRNMLFDYLRRLVPGAAHSRVVGLGGPEEVKYARAREELEKISWQNINRVTLSGGGDANYAIAKDDVGNWYVKSYATDARSIFNSARSLALFNLGRKIDTNLLDRAEARSLLNSANEQERAEGQRRVAAMDRRLPAATALLSSSQERAARRYFTSSQDDRVVVQGAFEGLPDRLQIGWTPIFKAAEDAPREPPEVPPDYKKAQEQLIETVERLRDTKLTRAMQPLSELAVESLEQQGDYLRYGKLLNDVVAALPELGRDIQAAIDSMPESTALTPALRVQLKSITAGVVNGMVEEVVRLRQATIRAYQDSLAPLMEAAGGA